MTNNYDRQILALDDTQLERFVHDWITQKEKDYVRVRRYSGPGDMGRDVVGFLTEQKHEGPWHNYQCKQYIKKLPTGTAILEIGKILYYAYKEEFTVPEQYFFVAPNGIHRDLEKLIDNPSQFKSKLIDEWDKYCSKKIKDGSTIPLDEGLMAFICAFNFSTIERFSLDDILTDNHIKPVLHKWFGEDLGPAPRGQTPAKIQDSELPYIKQLIGTYGQRCGQNFADYNDIENYPEFSVHLSDQRERFYDADAFERFYRDNTGPEVIETFEKDIYHGVIQTYNFEHKDSLARVDAVMDKASILPAGPLATHITVKQGICHHFANRGIFKWHQ